MKAGLQKVAYQICMVCYHLIICKETFLKADDVPHVTVSLTETPVQKLSILCDQGLQKCKTLKCKCKSAD